MNKLNFYLISVSITAKDVLRHLEFDSDSIHKTLFVVDINNKLVGSVTDGDIRRGLLNGREINEKVTYFMNKNVKYINNYSNQISEIQKLKELGIFLVPVLDNNDVLIDILDLRTKKTLIPATAVIMAGGRGERLKPYTDFKPKPLLEVGGKPIIEHNIDRLILFGIKEIYICVRYLSEQIINYLKDGANKGILIKYIHEDMPLGTLGAVSKITSCSNDDILLLNSDILTNIDYEDFYKHYLSSGSDMCIASIPYQVQVPYAVLDTECDNIKSFVEKPNYTYYCNGGIYLFKKSSINLIPKDCLYNATDLLQDLINSNSKIVHYPMLNYWLDIGKHQDFIKAQEDIKHLNF